MPCDARHTLPHTAYHKCAPNDNVPLPTTSTSIPPSAPPDHPCCPPHIHPHPCLPHPCSLTHMSAPPLNADSSVAGISPGAADAML